MDQKANAVRIGQKLRALRGIRTRRGVAKELGISYSALCNYEIGLRIPTDAIKVRIAEYYGQSVQNIFFS